MNSQSSDITIQLFQHTLQTSGSPATRLDHNICQCSGHTPIFGIIGDENSDASKRLPLRKACNWSLACLLDISTMASSDKLLTSIQCKS